MSSNISAATEKTHEDGASIADSSSAACAGSSAGRETREKTVDADGFNTADEVSGIKLALIIVGLCFSNILTGLDFTLIATAVPVITSYFNSLDDVGWYGSAYFIAMCVALPLAGKIYMFFPKKTIYLIYVGVFELGSLVCALAPTSKALIVGRAISGLGASGIFAGSLIVVATVAPLHKRPLLTGMTNGSFGASQIIGPLIGGAFAQNVTWRWCFWINLPVGGLSAALIVFFLRLRRGPTESSPLRNKIVNLDLLGFTIFAGSIVMLLLALQWGAVEYPWDSSVIIGLFVGFGVTFAIFLGQQWYTGDSALVPPRLFHYRTAILTFVVCLISPGGVAIIIYYLPIWFQAVLGATPVSSGLRYLPSVISDVLTSIIGGAIVMNIGWYNPFYIFGVAILSIGSGLMTTFVPQTAMGKWIGYQILTGSGYSFMVTMPHIALQAILPADLVPVASTTLLFAMTASCSILLAGGQAIFRPSLARYLLGVVSQEETDRLIAAGAADVKTAIRAAGNDSKAIIDAYNHALTNTFFVPAVGAAVSVFLVCAIEWKNIKTKASPLNEKGSEKVSGDPQDLKQTA